MRSFVIRGGTVYTPFEVIDGGAVLVRDGRIAEVGRDVATPEGAEEVDARDGLVMPGFVDLQVNGGGGVLLTEEPTQAALERMTRAHARFGTTAMLPTIVSAPVERMAEGARVAGEASRAVTRGARVLGVHVEGPFLNPGRRGAHEEAYLRSPLDDGVAQAILTALGRSRMWMTTLAPELDGALRLIEALKEAGGVVSLGHSDATYEEGRTGVEAGATMVTHLFNAMRPLHQREPGLIGVALEDERVVAGVIADGVHVHLSLLALAWRAKGAGGVALVTDAMPAVGAEEGAFDLGGRRVEVRGGACYLEDGTLAGSALSMDRAVRTMHAAGVPLRDCIEMATATPARVLGLEGEIGLLRPGALADIVVCDREMRVRRVYVGGEEAWAEESDGSGRG